MTSSLTAIERARPLLGTTVSIRVAGLSESDTHRAIDDAFAEIAAVHRLMSFHEKESDLSRLHRTAHGQAVTVHPMTYEVLGLAKEFSDESHGCFDVTVAPRLVEWGMLPGPDGPCLPDASASSNDIVLLLENAVRFDKPLWIDLGGIAKGYAVDRAVEVLIARGAAQITVNAGGDLRIHGPRRESVRLRTGESGGAVPILEIENAALASSSGHFEKRLCGGEWRGPHLDGRGRRPVPPSRFVSVVAGRCVTADALTKIALAMQEESEPLLLRYGASAHLFDAERGWRHLGIP
jgi:FAD:protein FMN transferase